MSKESLTKTEEVQLSEYLTPDKFRTVRDDAMLGEGGISEIKVRIEMRDAFAKTLNFDYSSLHIIYGFAIMSKKLKEVNKNYHASYFGDGVLKRIVLSDNGDKFIMVLELSDAPDILLNVNTDDVRELLNNCMHAKPE